MALKAIVLFGLITAALWLNNTSAFIEIPENDRVTKLIAHRGVHQIYTGENKANDTCRAESVAPITHRYIENTISSMKAAFDFGADVVELDVHLTSDDVLAVYHDWRLECQTDGNGVTHEQNYEYLESLDLGYGFSDDGETYPLRGNTDAFMPRIEDVLGAGMSGEFLVNFKSGQEADGQQFVKVLADQRYHSKMFGVYGGKKPTRTVTKQLGNIKGFDRSALKACGLSYFAIGWTGLVPNVCKNRIIAIPMNYGQMLWGWPHRFTARMKTVNTDVILLGPYDGTGFSSGVDDVETLARVPNKFDGYIWTNNIEVVGPLVTSNTRF